mgnify:CR=1 FL=1
MNSGDLLVIRENCKKDIKIAEYCHSRRALLPELYKYAKITAKQQKINRRYYFIVVDELIVRPLEMNWLNILIYVLC